MRRFGIIAAAVCGMSLLAASAQADDRSPIRLLDNAQTAAGATTSVDVTPVRVGTGWRGYGYYPGWGRPYYYGGGYRGGYYGNYYRPYYGGYNNYYQPYYNAYRPYYGGYYWRY